jgi:hypothetical protein
VKRTTYEPIDPRRLRFLTVVSALMIVATILFALVGGSVPGDIVFGAMSAYFAYRVIQYRRVSL